MGTMKTQEIKDYRGQPAKTINEKQDVTGGTSGEKEDSNSSLPYTGVEENILLLVGIAAISVFGIASKKLYNKYRNI